MNMYINSILLMAGGDDQNPMTAFLPIILIIVVFYFFMIRPQMKKQKDMRNYREALKTGDKVLTTGGIYGRIKDVKEHVVILEVENNMMLRVDKNAILQNPEDLGRK